MKTFLTILLLLSLGFQSCKTSGLIALKNRHEKQLIVKVLDCWVKQDNDKVKDFIAPSFILKYKIDLKKFEINYFTPEKYIIEKVNNSIVTVKLIGPKKKWVHLAEFLVVSENGNYYIYPSKVEGKYIFPWQLVTQFITETE